MLAVVAGVVILQQGATNAAHLQKIPYRLKIGMYKGVPHYSLPAMQSAVAVAGIQAFTVLARRGGREMGLTVAGMLSVIASLNRGNFYKSMTSYRDNTVWQDVYHAVCPNGKIAYIKLTKVEDRIVIQFKEK